MLFFLLTYLNGNELLTCKNNDLNEKNRGIFFDSPNFGRKEKCRNVKMSKSKKVENKNDTNVEMLNTYVNI